ncbi:MAG: aminopeptidase P family protein [Deltaproteobacteria bacterium]|nr:MAG: aminopeptidase P family protein [Deltaproteobacteria bacterium]
MTNNMTYPLTYDLVPPEEIYGRISRLQQKLTEAELSGALILDGINMFYYTGTIQMGILFVPAHLEPVLFIRRSFDRAKRETPLKALARMKSFGDLPGVLKGYGYRLKRIGLDETTLRVSVQKKLAKAFPGAFFEDISSILSEIRTVKSDYEIGLIREAGRRHKAIFDCIPGMIHEGMTEWELGSAIHAEMLKLGYTGIGRFSGSDTEFFAGIVSFGESSNFPTASLGPGGLVGLCPAFPLLGGARRLKKDDVIFIDTGFAYGGYYSDMTRIYCLGRPPQAAVDAHNICLEIQEAVRSRLRPGAIPSEIFEEVYKTQVVPRRFEENFMGFGSNQLPFLGHGVGLIIDEVPVIARKTHLPLRKNMVIALEPKKGIKGTGLVGIENTFLVTEQGGEKLTPGPDNIIIV